MRRNVSRNHRAGPHKSVLTNLEAANNDRTGTEGTETIGNHGCYGDGSEISLDDLETVRAVLRDCEVAFPWRQGDVMMIDNILAMHGRKPYTGSRKVVVAMG